MKTTAIRFSIWPAPWAWLPTRPLGPRPAFDQGKTETVLRVQRAW